MLSERIANEIMTEIHEVVKEFVSDTIAGRRSFSFDDIETRVSELKESFGKRLSEGALEAIGSGHVGQRIACQCGGVMEYNSDRRWKLTRMAMLRYIAHITISEAVSQVMHLWMSNWV